MSTVLFYLFLTAFFLVCLMLVLVILAQEGKGGGLSGMAGTTAIGETFGFSGAAEGMRRWTRNVAIVFFLMCIALTFWGENIMGGSLAERFINAPGDNALAPTTEPADASTPPAPATDTPAAATEAPATEAPATETPSTPAEAAPPTDAAAIPATEAAPAVTEPPAEPVTTSTP